MRVALTEGSYQARSIIADAQRCVNLYTEKNPEDAPFPFTNYPRPGLTVFSTPPTAGISRGLYRASTGDLYNCVGTTIYYITSAGVYTALGTIAKGSGMVSFSDNGLVVIVVDGTTSGYAIDMKLKSFAPIVSPYFYGANKVDYCDTFFLFNLPGTNQWYISQSEPDFALLTSPTGAIITGSIGAAGTGYTNGTYLNVPMTGGSGTGAVANITVAGGVITGVTIIVDGINYVVGDSLSAADSNIGGTGTGFTYSVDSVGGGAFDVLDIAAKEGSPDPIVSLIVVLQEVWLVGALTSEVWYDSGAADFTFQQVSQAFVEHGCIALYSLCKQDTSAYWLSQDREGRCIVMRGVSYTGERISTHAIENIFASYSTVSDAIGYVYQMQGHTFYVLNFPTANATWVYDQGEQQWHQEAYTDANGNLNRHLANCAANAYGYNLCGDWQTGTIYYFDINNYTDNGQTITRIRSFPHMVNDGKRVMHNQFIADMDVGQDTNAADTPTVTLRWSDTKGASWGNGIYQTLGQTGQYIKNVQFRRLGLARDRVYELSWSNNAVTALNGAYIDLGESAT